MQEKSKKLSSEINKLKAGKEQQADADRETWNRYHGLLTKHNELTMLGETDKAQEVSAEIEKLEPEITRIRSGISNTDFDAEIKKAIKNNSDNSLHQLAEDIQKEALVKMGVLEDNFQFIKTDLAKAKIKFLDVLAQLGNSYRELFDLYWIVRKAESVLPEEKHKLKQPQRAPNWSDFEITEEETRNAYGDRPFIVS